MKKIEHIENRSIFIDFEIGLSKKIDKKKRENKPEHQLSFWLKSSRHIITDAALKWNSKEETGWMGKGGWLCVYTGGSGGDKYMAWEAWASKLSLKALKVVSKAT